MEDIEDRSKRNNLQLRGLPEATGTEDLSKTAAAIFRNITGVSLPAQLVFDKIHRAPSPLFNDPARSRDVVCRLHHYTHKEIVLRKAWETGAIDFDGASV